jgi:hypothetical protein
MRLPVHFISRLVTLFVLSLSLLFCVALSSICPISAHSACCPALSSCFETADDANVTQPYVTLSQSSLSFLDHEVDLQNSSDECACVTSPVVGAIIPFRSALDDADQAIGSKLLPNKRSINDALASLRLLNRRSRHLISMETLLSAPVMHASSLFDFWWPSKAFLRSILIIHDQSIAFTHSAVCSLVATCVSLAASFLWCIRTKSKRLHLHKWVTIASIISSSLSCVSSQAVSALVIMNP